MLRGVIPMAVAESTPRWAALSAFGLPAALAMLCAGNGMGFLDSPELAAAGAGLAVTHPPGHPLFVAVAALASLVPVGSVSFRMEITQAILLGVIGRMLLSVAHDLCARIAGNTLGGAKRWLAALAGALAGTLGTGTFRQATRVEVYALAGALALSMLVLASRPRGERETSLAMRARAACLLTGLGAADHHFIQLTAAPLGLWVLWERLEEARVKDALSRARAFLRAIPSWAGLFALGLIPYVILPLRASAPASIARVRTLAEFFDVVSARIYARNAGGGVPGAAGGRALDVLDWLGVSLTVFGLVFALGGVYLAAREKRARPALAKLGVLVAVVTLARGYLGFVRDNPDAAGYLVPAVGALGVLIAGFIAGSMQALANAKPAPEGPSAPARAILWAVLVGGPLALPFYQGISSVRASAEDRTYSAGSLARAALTPLPPRSVLFAYDPGTVFRLRYAMETEGERPDVVVVPVGFLGYPGAVPWLLARDSALTPLIGQYLLRPDQGLSPRLVSSLAATRVVVTDLDPRNIQPNVAVLIPRGLLYEIAAEPTTLATVRGAAAAHFTALDQLTAQFAREPAAARPVGEVLLWHDYTDALFFAARGARAEARRAVARGLEIDPESHELTLLRTALATPGEAPLDVTPFLTGSQ